MFCCNESNLAIKNFKITTSIKINKKNTEHIDQREHFGFTKRNVPKQNSEDGNARLKCKLS